eukprot:TRINITY_DN1306_c0_g1_i1.p1 TRINITY_DN1306_c0_g1~~TRINITY_DN1306_c0_g1_i1.p1  ORF type:complete len:517 (-),score=130.26 TRINITY_DN1306_c0_g1_i1:55-1383(-)
MCNLSGVVARQLLKANKWDGEKLINKFFGGEKKKMFEEAKIPLNLSEWNIKDIKGPIECTICFDEVPIDKASSLPCNHFFCKECYRDYLENSIINHSKSGGIQCPKNGCNLQVDEITALDLLPKESKARQLYYTLAAREYIKGRKELRSCPGGTCDKIIEYHMDEDDIPIVECACGDKLCWDCGMPDHSPALCKMIMDWNIKKNKDVLESKDKMVILKNCPNPKGCTTIIEKNDGCQYMTCPTCHYPFCWICETKSAHEKHNCNSFKIDPNLNPQLKELAKDEHFKKRFTFHEQSVLFQSKLKTKCEELVKILINHMSYNDTLFVEESRKTTIIAHRMLKDSYIFGYYIPENVNIQLFEYIQGELESNTGRLEYYLEGDPKIACQKHLEIKDLSITIRKNIDSIIEDIFKGGMKGSGRQSKQVYDEVDKNKVYQGWIYNPGN